MIAESIFWSAVAIPWYAFAGYPLVLLGLGLAIHRKVHKAPFVDSVFWPSVSLLIPAYNEARVIARKIENSLALDYPGDRIEIIVVCDGCTDGTASIAASFHGVRVLALPANRGKMAALNAAVPALHSDIVVFSDASAMLAPDSVRRVVENFSDPSVGSVCGHYTVVAPKDVNIGAPEKIYWQYESIVKAGESRLGSTMGAHGHLHAIRSELYPFPADQTINDDYVIPLSVIRRGFRAVYEPAAIVYEEAREMTGFGRRIRIVAGNVQQLGCLGQFLRPFQPLPLFFFLSHKVARLFVPFAMLTAIGVNLLLLGAQAYRLLFGVQVLFYAVALLGLTGRLCPRALRLPFYFCMVNIAAFLGLYHALTGRRTMAWK